MAVPSSPQTRATRLEKPNALACVACRKRHLKCDGVQPICGRCSQTDAECIYVRSRRGMRISHRGNTATPTRAPAQTHQLPTPPVNFNTAPETGANTSAQDVVFNTTNIPTPSEDTVSIVGTTQSNVESSRLIDAFYQYVHPAHPIVLPRKLYLQDTNILPAYLKHIMCYMASHVTGEPLEPPRLETWLGMNDSGFKVQALVLFALDSFARFERESGARALMEAQTIATRIGMYSNAFAQHQSAIMRESWRRTWWELYTVSSLISLISGVDMRLPLHEDLSLPGNCSDYNSGIVLETATGDLGTMRHRFASEQSHAYSSFSYKIEAARILNIVVKADAEGAAEGVVNSNVRMANALVSGYLLSLPKHKRNATLDDGNIDEVMSCALMIINLASICLHFPRSGIIRSSSFKTVCGNDRGSINGPGIIDEKTHRLAALRSADNLSCLISSRQELNTLTPCFSCAISFAAAVHLSTHVSENVADTAHKEHVNLELMALNIIGEVWPIARVVRGQIAQFARQVMQRRPQVLTPISQSASAVSSLPAAQPPVPLLDEQWLQDLVSNPIDFPMDSFYFDLT